MNLDNNDDYFLHDFSDKPEANSGQPQNTPAQPGQTVDFSTPSGHEAPRPELPQHKRGGCRRFWAWFFAIIIVALCLTVAIRYFIPYTTDSQVTGYVVSVEKRGILCKTFEGELISHAALSDSTRIYERELTFSIPSDSLARVIQSYQGSGRPVTLIIERYYGTLPWRGASSTIAVGVKP